MSSDPAATPAVAAPGGASKIPLIIGALNMALSGFLVFHAIKAPKIVPVAAAAEKEEKGPKEELPGPSVTFEPLVINLNEPGSNRYLKTSFDVEVTDAKAAELVTERKRVIRDEFLRYLSGLGVADTLGEANKTKIKEQLVARADTAAGGKSKVKAIFFNEFVVQ